jgi:hypothetical protein
MVLDDQRPHNLPAAACGNPKTNNLHFVVLRASARARGSCRGAAAGKFSGAAECIGRTGRRKATPRQDPRRCGTWVSCTRHELCPPLIARWRKITAATARRLRHQDDLRLKSAVSSVSAITMIPLSTAQARNVPRCPG